MRNFPSEIKRSASLSLSLSLAENNSLDIKRMAYPTALSEFGSIPGQFFLSRSRFRYFGKSDIRWLQVEPDTKLAYLSAVVMRSCAALWVYVIGYRFPIGSLGLNFPAK